MQLLLVVMILIMLKVSVRLLRRLSYLHLVWTIVRLHSLSSCVPHEQVLDLLADALDLLRNDKVEARLLWLLCGLLIVLFI